MTFLETVILEPQIWDVHPMLFSGLDPLGGAITAGAVCGFAGTLPLITVPRGRVRVPLISQF